jgi:hypothetical protein
MIVNSELRPYVVALFVTDTDCSTPGTRLGWVLICLVAVPIRLLAASMV